MLKRRSSSMTTSTTNIGGGGGATTTTTSPSQNGGTTSTPRKNPHHSYGSSSPSSLSSTMSRSPLPRQYQYQRPEITSTTRFRIVGSSSNNSTGSSSPHTPPNNNNNNNDHDNSYYYNNNNNQQQLPLLLQQEDELKHDDTWNYALLIVLYILQGIPMGLSASIPFLIQQKIQTLLMAASSSSSSSTTAAAAAAVAATTTSSTEAANAAAAAATTARTLYLNANAIFALCSWPFSLKLLWAPIVDACFFPKFGRRKSWLVPCQSVAGMLMVLGSNFVEQQLGFSTSTTTGGGGDHLTAQQFHVQGLTLFFLVLYFLMATQDIAVDGWALTLLSPQNRSRGPVCNSIGQNIGYFGSFVGFLALNDIESSEKWWRPLLGLPSNPNQGLVSLGGFLRFMGYLMLVTTAAVAIFKNEQRPYSSSSYSMLAQQQQSPFKKQQHQQPQLQDEDAELDASVIGLRETYHRLWAVCQLPAVRWLFWILFTYRLPTSLSDNVKFLKAVEYGLSKSTTALLSPTIILPVGILVPIVAAKIWHGHPLRQFMTAYKLRVTIVPLLDVLMLWALKHKNKQSGSWWMITLGIVIFSTAAQAIVQSLQFNSQMMFFAKKVDPAIGGSYMTLLNTAANLGGTWPSSFVLWLLSRMSSNCDTTTTTSASGAASSSTSCRDPYFAVQAAFSLLGLLWIWFLGGRVQQISQLPDDAWRTHLLDDLKKDDDSYDLESNNNNNKYSYKYNETALITTPPRPQQQQHPYQYNFNAYASTASSFSPDISTTQRNLSSVEVELGGTNNNNSNVGTSWHRHPRQHQQQLL